MEGYAGTASPLYALTKKKRKWSWNEEEEQAFVKMKDNLTSAPVLRYPDMNQPYILYTDACDYAIGGILCQEDENGLERPIHYISHQLNDVQRRWATIEKEAYAVVYALKKLRPYLLGSYFTVYTDHKPLLSLFLGEVQNTKIQRWAVLLAEFGAKIKYRPGKANYKADMLSRIRAPEEELGIGIIDVVDVMARISTTGEKQEEVNILDADAEWIGAGDREAQESPQLPLDVDGLDLPAIKTAQATEFPDLITDAADPDSRYLMLDGVLYSRARPNPMLENFPRLVLPAAWRSTVVKRCHEEVGHQSLFKTMAQVQEFYVWKGMKGQIQRYLDQCGQCLVHNKQKVRTPLGEMPFATRTGEIVSIDLIGPLISSYPNENKYIMVCLDHFTGWAEAYPLKNKSNEAVWDRLRNDYVPRHSYPNIILTDQGSEFKGTDFNNWLLANRIEHRRTTPYNPQCNGRSERLNRTLKGMLKKLINGERSSWEDQLGVALTAYRVSTSTVTGFSPFMLTYLRPPRLALSRSLDHPEGWDTNDRLKIQAEILGKAATATQESRHYNRERLARKANDKDIAPGDRVMLAAREPMSLTAKWDPGYVVQRVRGKVLTVMCPRTRKEHIVNKRSVRLTDPDIAWDEVAPRPKRQQGKGMRAPNFPRQQVPLFDPYAPPDREEGAPPPQAVPPPGPPPVEQDSDSSVAGDQAPAAAPQVAMEEDPQEGQQPDPGRAVTRSRRGQGRKDRGRSMRRSTTPPVAAKPRGREDRGRSIRRSTAPPVAAQPPPAEAPTAVAPPTTGEDRAGPQPLQTNGGGAAATPGGEPHRYNLRQRTAKSYQQSTTEESTDTEVSHRRPPGRDALWQRQRLQYQHLGERPERTHRRRRRRRRRATVGETPPPPAVTPPPQAAGPPSPPNSPTPNSGAKRVLTTTDDDHDSKAAKIEGAEKRGPSSDDSLEEREHPIKLSKPTQDSSQ